VARFFGEVNELHGIVHNRSVATPFGVIAADGHPEAATVQVVIRPEGLKLAPANGDASGLSPGSGPERAPPACFAKVLAARLLGRSSWIHLSIGGPGIGEHDPMHSHFHARVPGTFLPPEGEVLEVRLDPAQAFVFKAGEAA
jgi:iron(III) transport system ATP-binding protein